MAEAKTKTLIQRLVEIQQKLKAPKNQRNDFGKYNYRSCEDILEAVKPLLKEQEVALTLSDEPIMVGEWHYVRATAKVTFGSDYYETTAYAREPEIKKGMDESQITGTASSYARKYALNGLFAIDDTKDADTNAVTEASGTKKGASKELLEKAKSLGIDLEKMKAYYKGDLSESNVSNAIARKERAIASQKKKEEDTKDAKIR